MIINAAFFLAGVVSCLVFHYLHSNKLRKSHNIKAAQIDSIRAEIDAVEKTADRRIVVEIYKITNRMKALL